MISLFLYEMQGWGTLMIPGPRAQVGGMIKEHQWVNERYPPGNETNISHQTGSCQKVIDSQVPGESRGSGRRKGEDRKGEVVVEHISLEV